MKKFIMISLLIGLCGVNMMSQHKVPKRLPWDSLPRTLPPFKIEPADTLRFFPGDTIPNPIWEKYLKRKDQGDVSDDKILVAPQDNMPVIVPPDRQFQMIVVRPDTTFHYYLRNLSEEKKKNPLQKNHLIEKKKRP